MAEDIRKEFADLIKSQQSILDKFGGKRADVPMNHMYWERERQVRSLALKISELPPLGQIDIDFRPEVVETLASKGIKIETLGTDNPLNDIEDLFK